MRWQAERANVEAAEQMLEQRRLQYAREAMNLELTSKVSEARVKGTVCHVAWGGNECWLFVSGARTHQQASGYTKKQHALGGRHPATIRAKRRKHMSIYMSTHMSIHMIRPTRCGPFINRTYF